MKLLNEELVMTQEDKELLLKDLCARLPYGVKCIVTKSRTEEGQKGEVGKIGWVSLEGVDCIGNREPFFSEFGNFKLYLFPLSSLNEEQRNNVSKLLIDTQNEFSPYGELNMKGCDNLFICSVKQSNALINYCLANHLDINGLIEKELATDATGLNIY